MNQRKEAIRNAEREYNATGTLEEGLKSAKALLRRTETHEAYRFLDTLCLEHGEAFRERVIEISPEYHADITETVEFEGRNWEGETASFRIVRREAQGLEAITERTIRRPTLGSENGHVYDLGWVNSELDRIPEELYQLPQLQDLWLHGNQITTLQGLPNLPQLQDLWLHGNQITTLQHLPNLPQLRDLGLSDNQLTTLQGLPNLTKLQHIYLTRNQLKTLQHLPNLQQLEDLRLGNNQLTTLQGLPKLPKLQQIWLEGNQIPQQEKLELKERGVTVYD